MPIPEQPSDKQWFTKRFQVPLEDAIEFAKLPSAFGAFWRNALTSVNHQLPTRIEPVLHPRRGNHERPQR